MASSPLFIFHLTGAALYRREKYFGCIKRTWNVPPAPPWRRTGHAYVDSALEIGRPRSRSNNTQRERKLADQPIYLQCQTIDARLPASKRKISAHSLTHSTMLLLSLYPSVTIHSFLFLPATHITQKNGWLDLRRIHLRGRGFFVLN